MNAFLRYSPALAALACAGRLGDQDEDAAAHAIEHSLAAGEANVRNSTLELAASDNGRSIIAVWERETFEVTNETSAARKTDIAYRISPDGGETWSGIEIVADRCRSFVHPTVAISRARVAVIAALSVDIGDSAHPAPEGCSQTTSEEIFAFGIALMEDARRNPPVTIASGNVHHRFRDPVIRAVGEEMMRLAWISYDEENSGIALTTLAVENGGAKLASTPFTAVIEPTGAGAPAATPIPCQLDAQGKKDAVLRNDGISEISFRSYSGADRTLMRAGVDRCPNSSTPVALEHLQSNDRNDDYPHCAIATAGIVDTKVMLSQTGAPGSRALSAYVLRFDHGVETRRSANLVPREPSANVEIALSNLAIDPASGTMVVAYAREDESTTIATLYVAKLAFAEDGAPSLGEERVVDSIDLNGRGSRNRGLYLGLQVRDGAALLGYPDNVASDTGSGVKFAKVVF